MVLWVFILMVFNFVYSIQCETFDLHLNYSQHYVLVDCGPIVCGLWLMAYGQYRLYIIAVDYGR